MALKSTAAQEMAAAPPSRPAEPKPAARMVSPKPIAVYLMLLVAVTIIPSFAFSIVLLRENNQAQQQVVSTLAATTAASMAQTVDREIGGMITTLRVLSTAPSLLYGGNEDFYERAIAALAGSGAYLILLDQNQNQLFNTRAPYGAKLDKAGDPASANEALKSKKTVVSNGFFDRVAGQWVFDIAMPVYAKNGPPRVLVLTENASELAKVLGSQKLGDGWNVAIVDGNNKVIASSSPRDKIGQPFFIDLISHGPAVTGKLFAESRGEPVEAIVQGSMTSGWYIALWAPTATIEGPMRRSLQWLAVGCLIVVLLGTAAALLLTRQVSWPMRRLVRDAKRLGAGDPVEAVNYPIAEMATVSAAMAKAARRRKEAENEIRFLMREVAHRSKNQLTVVASIAKQTGRNARSVAEYQDSFQKRLFGLARSTDLLIAGGIAGVELGELLEVQIEPFRPDDPERVELSGPEVRLGNQAAQTLGLALHELATNAAKYGAFAAPSGRLVVGWRVEDEMLKIGWREYVPRLRRRPEKRGFGTQVIERMLGGTLGAKSERTLHRNGLEWQFSIALDQLRPSGSPAGDPAESASPR